MPGGRRDADGQRQRHSGRMNEIVERGRLSRTIPASATSDALLSDGRVVQVRPIDASDAERLFRFHESLSPETTRLRFFAIHPYLSAAEVERFSTVDHHDREA